jgi:hypothetical protein
MMLVAVRKTFPDDHISSAWRDGTHVGRIRFPTMSVSLSQLLEESFQIAWEYLERTDELGDAAAASWFLSDTIETMIRRASAVGWPSPIEPLSTYQRHRSSGAEGSAGAACSSA